MKKLTKLLILVSLIPLALATCAQAIVPTDLSQVTPQADGHTPSEPDRTDYTPKLPKVKWVIGTSSKKVDRSRRDEERTYGELLEKNKPERTYQSDVAFTPSEATRYDGTIYNPVERNENNYARSQDHTVVYVILCLLAIVLIAGLVFALK